MVVIHGDCLDVMAGMEPESVDAIVTDPPYGLEFMGKEWDKLDLKRGRHVGNDRRSFGETGKDHPAARNTAMPIHNTSLNPKCEVCGRYQWGPTPEQAAARGRTHHKCMCEAPKFRARNLAPQMQAWHQQWAEAAYRVAKPSAYLLAFGGTRTVHRMTVALEDAGWIIRDMLVWAYASGFPKSKASLKPAWEPIVMARKPGPLRMLAIDECRIPAQDADLDAVQRQTDPSLFSGQGAGHVQPMYSPLGRWPANVILTDPIFDGGVEGVVGGGTTESGSRTGQYAGSASWSGEYGPVARDIEGDSGTYSRFFLIPKADRADREPVLGGHKHRPVLRRFEDPFLEEWRCDDCGAVVPYTNNHVGRDMTNPKNAIPGGQQDRVSRGLPAVEPRANSHPTVKPTDLMRHLVRLVTPTGGTVLDPFLGSGTTALAAEMEGFAWIGIEREAEYVAIAEARLNGTQRGLGLETA